MTGGPAGPPVPRPSSCETGVRDRSRRSDPVGIGRHDVMSPMSAPSPWSAPTPSSPPTTTPSAAPPSGPRAPFDPPSVEPPTVQPPTIQPRMVDQASADPQTRGGSKSRRSGPLVLLAVVACVALVAGALGAVLGNGIADWMNEPPTRRRTRRSTSPRRVTRASGASMSAASSITLRRRWSRSAPTWRVVMRSAPE